MKKLSMFLVLMMLMSMIPMMHISADALTIFGSNTALMKGEAPIMVEQGSSSKQLIVAGYEGDAMTSATPVTIPAGSSDYEVTLPAFSKDTTAAKFFLWDNFDSMTPLMSTVSRDFTQTDYYTINITYDDIKQGGWGYSAPNSSANRIGTKRAIPVTKGTIFTYKLNGMKLCIDDIPHLSAGKDDTIRTYWITKDGSYEVTRDGYLCLTLALPNDPNITPTTFNTYNPELTIKLPANNDIQITTDDLSSGGYVYGATVDNAKRIRVDRLIYLKEGSIVNYDVGDLQIHIANLENGEEANAYAQSSGWKTGSGSFTFTSTGYLAIIMMIDDNTPISVADYDNYGASISISAIPDITVITPDNIERGAWAHGTKLDSATYLASRLRVDYLIPVYEGGVLSYDTNGLQMYVRQINTDKNATTTSYGWTVGSGTFTATADGYFGIAFAIDSAADTYMTFADYEAQIAVQHGTPTPPIDTTSTYPEGHRIIEEFGGQGNDWSFVYLPDDYYTDTSKTYPFVILNHGNGWNMDGSEAMANYSNITMYMPPTASNLTNDRFICTDDSSIWYSNPTIEALLDAGYIVAGAQNYGDNLYGNDNCRKACADFYDYMVANYRVQADSCFMVGASNGCMTTLNTANYLLNRATNPVRIKGIILQYPLCGLKDHYLAGGHNAAIQSAYGVSATLTADNFYEYIDEEFDPVATDVAAQGYFPATKIYYSNSDTVTKASANALKLIAMLEDTDVELETFEASGQHGDVSHFDPEGFVEWFNKCLDAE